MYGSPFGVRRNNTWRYKLKFEKTKGQKSGKSINKSEMKFYMFYNSICKN